jgi:hypothetical protein
MINDIGLPSGSSYGQRHLFSPTEAALKLERLPDTPGTAVRSSNEREIASPRERIY